MVRRVIAASRFVAFLVVLVGGGCGPGFYNARTPSGGLVADMPVIPFGGQALDQLPEYHRIGAVTSSLRDDNAAERFESIRRAAWKKDADGVIEVLQAEVRLPTTNKIRYSGTAVRFKAKTR